MVAALPITLVPPAFAQGPDLQRGTGVFGRETPAPESRQALDLTVSLTAAYDDDVSEAPRALANELFGRQSIVQSNQLLGNADYQLQSRDVDLRANARSAVRHNRENGVISPISHAAAIGVTAMLPYRTSFVVNQTGTYSPSYLYNLLPNMSLAGTVDAPIAGEAPAAAPDYVVQGFESFSLGTQATLTHEITRRSIVLATTDLQHTDYWGSSVEQTDPGWRSISAGFRRTMTRNTRASARYLYRIGNFPYAAGSLTTGTSKEHGLEIGVNHIRPRSSTRRMIFDVSLGSSLVSRPMVLTDLRPPDPSHRLIGQFSAAYTFGKSWQAGAMYRRGVDFVPGLTEPVETDGATARIDGLLTPRLDAMVSAAYLSGDAVFNNTTDTFDTYTGTVRLRYAVARTVAAYVEYLYYFYDFHGYPHLVPGVPPTFERNGVRAGLTLLIPAIRNK